ncbi:nicotinate-nicotinamide nucleotide adenylyltransferase [Oceanirhabdus sp. W0125-5]|uniref:nicotinate-nicotinamide nucleotide adenylyltransferase n=1 Tax=Oceanirhabdus sp. W0125-5 TaxID=2999116 RepID=UPI0022F30289|nr:cytidyltransferase [Oceanirhabdus sp. W0125-5]WBW95984.1 cytidyltransferase [Oceanirhabdus sp. W0125-5]
MSNQYDIIYKKIKRSLSSSKWLKNNNVDITIIESGIKSITFKSNLNTIIKNKRYSCKNILSLCESMMNDISPIAPPENWLEYLFNYTLNKSFPSAVQTELFEEYDISCELYLRLLRILSDVERYSKCDSFKCNYPLTFLTAEEINSLEYKEEYKKFLTVFKNDYIYEMMKLSQEYQGYNTLDHICGVHYVAMFIAYQLKSKDFPIDLGRVSGAAAGHDIGKYGCKGMELKRVPHLHYYYTDVWFKKYNINFIRNIAVNHSTWDLELENLSLESLILIYSDFRVKNKGRKMHIYSLEDSFNVILEKLENLDQAKEKRYRKVYAKLKDFEDFLSSSGIETDLNCTPLYSSKITMPNYALLHGKNIIQGLKFNAIDHNINLMHLLRDNHSLDLVLERARSEKDWKNLREYLRAIKEYCTYLTQEQKKQTLEFLFGQLTHSEDDIRRKCASIMGMLIAYYDEDYRKEIPADSVILNESKSVDLLKYYLNLMVHPKRQSIAIHKKWIGYSTRITINSLFKNSRDNMEKKYRDVIAHYYVINKSTNIESQLYLLEAAKYIPMNDEDESVKAILSYVLNMLNKKNSSLRISALETSKTLINKMSNNFFIEGLKEYINSLHKSIKSPAENMLIRSICSKLELVELLDIYTEYCTLDKEKIGDIFLSNLKSATNWIVKKNQIDLLVEYVLDNSSDSLQTAMHFCNILKVSEVESVRTRAGIALLKIMPALSLSKRNEIAVELLRALEIEGQHFTEYIPLYLGQIILYLPPKELNEIIEDQVSKIKKSNNNLKTLILKTIGIALKYYPEYKVRFKDSSKNHNYRLHDMLGILMNGLGDYSTKVNQAAIGVIGRDIFASSHLTLEDKERTFTLMGKKTLTLLTQTNENRLLFLSNSAALNHIYRFISDFTHSKGNLQIEIPKKIAFFPGTFDPFTLSHKEIARAISDEGFEVYLAVDEFSWSKRTLPNLLRKKIINMSIAEELNIFLFPGDIQINIANPVDLKKLKRLFPNSEVHMVAGSDVITNASSYQKEPLPYSIQTFPHIIFTRGKRKELDEAIKSIKNHVSILSLSSKFRDISSTQIRNCIDQNRDISKLINPVAERYIYENGFYQREPLNKLSINPSWIDVIHHEDIEDKHIKNISQKFTGKNDSDIIKFLLDFRHKESTKMVILKDKLTDKILAFSTFYWLRSTNFYNELHDTTICNYLRSQAKGRTIHINGLYVNESETSINLYQTLISETLAFAVAKDYEYAIFEDSSNITKNKEILNWLKLSGFIEVPHENPEVNVLSVDMSNPIVINLDIDKVIKEPYRSNNKVKNIVKDNRYTLLNSLTKLYPGNLVLSFDHELMSQSLIKLICEENNVPTEVSVPRKLGDDMCVPYGDILDRYVVPNTVTKSLHIEKLFAPNTKSFNIVEFPYYLSMENQVKMIQSFKRDVILVDNLLHKGYRMQALDPLLKKCNLKIKNVIVGILSGRGKDLMDMQNREVRSVYFIPRLRIWFNESNLYPFLGGDALWRGNPPTRNLIPSINMVLPYTFPFFIRDTSKNSIFDFSKVCLDNSMNMLKVIEGEFYKYSSRNLTLSNLGEVLYVPRIPEKGDGIKYELHQSPSHYLENDFELLNRFEESWN